LRAGARADRGAESYAEDGIGTAAGTSGTAAAIGFRRRVLQRVVWWRPVLCASPPGRARTRLEPGAAAELSAGVSATAPPISPRLSARHVPTARFGVSWIRTDHGRRRGWWPGRLKCADEPVLRLPRWWLR